MFADYVDCLEFGLLGNWLDLGCCVCCCAGFGLILGLLLLLCGGLGEFVVGFLDLLDYRLDWLVFGNAQWCARLVAVVLVLGCYG